MKRTKIVGTIGPASASAESIESLVRAGLNVARLNFSHGKHEEHAALIRHIRAVEKKLDMPIGIIQDLQGPRIRIGGVVETGVPVNVGQTVMFVPERGAKKSSGDGTVVPTQYPDLHKDVKVGHMILVEDGTLQFRVTKIKGSQVACRVLVGGTILSHKGMNFPDSDIRCPAVTPKDQRDLLFGLEHNVDFVALSFVRSAKDIVHLRQMIARYERKTHRTSQHVPAAPYLVGPYTQTKIIAKIERPQAVKNFAEILAAADGIMVARGDLGLEMPLENLPLVQKKLVQQCSAAGKPVIVATQMLDSMIRNPLPTRAEVTDVANAILDGADAIMLSGETASGKYPVKAVQVMTKIAHQVEQQEMKQFQKNEATTSKLTVTEAVTFAAQDVAEHVGAKFVAVTTASGFSARAIAKYKSRIAVLALAPTAQARRQLALSWGVQSYVVEGGTTPTEVIARLRAMVRAKKLAKAGEHFVLVSGFPHGYTSERRLLHVVTV